jgi:hypothetical protein
LLYKLIKAKVPHHIVRWIQEFLRDRRFEVRVRETVSDAQPIECGVPQGSVLSPVLFSLFINDIPARKNKNQNQSLLFADDICHLEIFNRPGRAEANINLYWSELEAWRLKMAPQKCAYIIFNNTKETPNLNLKLGGEVIARTSETTFLGVVLDEKLNFESHIVKLGEACEKRANIIKILSHPSWKLNFQTLKQLYFSLVRSLFEYSSILAPVITKTRIKTMQTIQNSALIAILRKSRETPIDILHSSAGVPRIVDRLLLLVERYLSNSIHHNNPLIVKLSDEFFDFSNGRLLPKPTLLDKHRNLIELSRLIEGLAINI